MLTPPKGAPNVLMILIDELIETEALKADAIGLNAHRKIHSAQNRQGPNAAPPGYQQTFLVAFLPKATVVLVDCTAASDGRL